MPAIDQTLSAVSSEASIEFDIIHAPLLQCFPELVRELGGDPKDMLDSVGVDAAALKNPTFRASYRQLTHLLQVAAVALDCPDFGMRLAQTQARSEKRGPRGKVMKGSQTFGDALAYVCEHNYAHSLAARVWLQHLHGNGKVFVGHDILLDGLPNKGQVMEQVLLAGHLTAKEMTGGRARVRRVHFRHQPLSAAGVYRRYFGCEIRFDQNQDGVVYSSEDMAQPVVDPDEQEFEVMVAYIDSQFTDRRPPVHAQVRGVIMRQLGVGDCTNQQVARELNLHLRTLHRRLGAEGTSFQRVKDEVRRDLLLYYLQRTRLDFARVSEKLGFSEQSVLTRRCQHWFAMNPTTLRQRGAG